ncbi:uncharacterized protein LOC144108816 [Amblyomma americanum]
MSWSFEGPSLETWRPRCEDEEDTLPSQERATSQEIELKEDIKEALKANGVYSNDKLCDTMAVLEILGVKAAQHFELLETEDLVSRGMPSETADTLLKEFGPAGDEAEAKPEDNAPQENGMAVLKSAIGPVAQYTCMGAIGCCIAWSISKSSLWFKEAIISCISG